MKRVVSLIAVALFVLVCSAVLLASPPSMSARSQEPPAEEPPVQPNPSGSVVGQSPDLGLGNPRPSLQCQGCHVPDKPLPYLAGARFHEQAHSAFEGGLHAEAARRGFNGPSCLDCHSSDGQWETVFPASDPRSTVHRGHLAITCGKCHGDPEVMKGTGISARPFLSYQESVHAKALSRGDLNAAVCTDCHNSHDVLSAADARSPIFKFNIPDTCGRCHPSIRDEFMQSIHGQAAIRGLSQTAVCTDCHGIHSILPEQQGAALRTNTCVRCHEGVRLTQEFGVAGNRLASYADSYHGLAKKLGSNVAADCSSCHGVHNVLPSDDPRSTVAPANLTQTCGQCHPNAGVNFTKGRVHLDVPASQDAASVGTYWVRLFYLTLIFGTIGLMVGHNAFVWWRKAAAKLRARNRTELRLTRNQRVQHWLLLTSFVVLVVSGFLLVYPDFWIGLGLGVNESTRRFVHRVAAVVMMAVGLYHIAYVAFTKEGRSWLRDMVPSMRDVRDFTQALTYYVLQRGSRPKFPRFGYTEKTEYWAVVWGTVIMGLTGLMIWFKTGAFGFVPRWWIDIAIAIHFYEAVLATLAIVVWHFYSVIFDPDVYPINLAFWDGKADEEHHPDGQPAVGEEVPGLEADEPVGGTEATGSGAQSSAT